MVAALLSVYGSTSAYTAAADEPRPNVGPIQGNWSAAVAYSALHPGLVPQGADDFSCKPTAAHPHPVVLVNGAFESEYINWSRMAPLLKADGFCVFGFDYGKMNNLPLAQVGALAGSAREVGAYIDKVLAATGASKVDLVGHSEGGLVPLYYINHLGGVRRIDKMISLAPITNGISFYGLMNWIAANPGVRDAVGATVPAAIDSTAYSRFVEATAVGGVTRPGISYLTVTSRTDMVVQVAESWLPAGLNVKNIVIQDLCPADLADHTGLVYDENVSRLVRNALDPTRAGQPPCNAVLPFVHQAPPA